MDGGSSEGGRRAHRCSSRGASNRRAGAVVAGRGVMSYRLWWSAWAHGSAAPAPGGRPRRSRPPARTVVLSALAFGVLETTAAWAPGFTSALFLLALTGFASLYFAQAANHRIQLGSDPDYRGRVMALYTLILQGSTPLGALLIGWLSQQLGARAGLLAGGLVSVGAAAVALVVE
ncbi:hypothetical protein DMH26_39105, partial [Streptomyces sp. WAC 05379]